MPRHAPFLLAVFLLPLVAGASPVPDVSLSSAAVYYHGPISVCVVPGGGGDLLSTARTLAGDPVDATVHVFLYGQLGDPVVGFPPEDIWFETTAGGLRTCGPLGTIADGPTDMDGYTSFSGAPSAGGHSAPGERLRVYIAGSPVGCCDLDIRFNSPDIDGNLHVDLTDLVLFSQLYTSGAYDHAADLYADGVLNLSDVQVFAMHYNVTCD